MKNDGKRKIYEKILSVSGIVLLAKLLGFIKQIVTANAFGATIHTDLISISEGLITNLDYLIVQAFTTAFVPIYIGIQEKDKDRSNKFYVNTLSLMLFLSVTLTTLFGLSSPILARILAPSYSQELSSKLANYIRILSPSLIIILQIAVFNSLLKAREQFNQGEIISLIQSLSLIILVICIGKQFSAETLIISFYVYAIIGLLYLIISARKFWGFKICNPITAIKDSDIKKLLVMMFPLLLGFSAIFINQQVDKIIVSGFGDGTVTAMSYAAVLSNFVCTFITSICGVLFTYISQNVAKKNYINAASLTINTSIQMITLLLPISLITVFNSHDIITVVFGHGAFESTAINNSSLALCGYGIMFVPYSLRELHNRFQYAYGDSKRPMINSSVSIIMNILLSITLSKVLGIFGVTLATSLSVFANCVFNIHFSKIKNDNLRISGLSHYLPKWLLGGVICVVVSFFAKIIFKDFSSLIRIVIVSIVSLFFYGLINKSILKSLIRKR